MSVALGFAIVLSSALASGVTTSVDGDNFTMRNKHVVFEYIDDDDYHSNKLKVYNNTSGAWECSIENFIVVRDAEHYMTNHSRSADWSVGFIKDTGQEARFSIEMDIANINYTLKKGWKHVLVNLTAKKDIRELKTGIYACSYGSWDYYYSPNQSLTTGDNPDFTRDNDAGYCVQYGGALPPFAFGFSNKTCMAQWYVADYRSLPEWDDNVGSWCNMAVYEGDSTYFSYIPLPDLDVSTDSGGITNLPDCLDGNHTCTYGGYTTSTSFAELFSNMSFRQYDYYNSTYNCTHVKVTYENETNITRGWGDSPNALLVYPIGSADHEPQSNINISSEYGDTPAVITETIPSASTFSYPEYFDGFTGLNVSLANWGNGKRLKEVTLNITNSSTSAERSANYSYCCFFENCPVTGDVTVNATRDHYNHTSTTLNINDSANATWTALLPPISYFFAEDQATNPLTGYNLNVSNTTLSKAFSTATDTLAIGLDLLPFSASTTFVFSKNGYNNSYETYPINDSTQINRTTTLTRAGILIKAFDEEDPSGGEQVYNLSLANTTFSDTWTNVNTSFSATYGNNSVPINDVTASVSKTGYYSRDYYYTFYNTTYVSIDAYLLPSTSANLINIHVKNRQDEYLENALVTAQKQINGSYVTVEQQRTDSSGTAALYLNPSTTYKLIASYPDYVSYEATITPTQSDYTFTLSSASVLGYHTLYEDLSYRFYPNLLTLGRGNQTVNFSVYSTGSALSSFGLNLSDENNTVFFSSTTTTSPAGGTIVGSFNATPYVNTEITATGWWTHSDYGTTGVNLTYNVHNWTSGERSVWNLLSNGFDDTGLTAWQQDLVTIIVLAVMSVGASLYLNNWAGALTFLLGLGFAAAAGWFSANLFFLLLLVVVALIIIGKVGI